MKHLLTPPKLAAAALVVLAALTMTSPAQAQEHMYQGFNCRSYPGIPTTPSAMRENMEKENPGNSYECYQISIWYSQEGSWCAKHWYQSCMHSGWLRGVRGAQLATGHLLWILISLLPE